MSRFNMKPLEVTGLIRQITKRTGILPDDIRSVLVTPQSALITRYLRNEQGKKYLNTDGEVAVEVIQVKVKFRG